MYRVSNYVQGFKLCSRSNGSICIQKGLMQNLFMDLSRMNTITPFGNLIVNLFIETN